MFNFSIYRVSDLSLFFSHYNIMAISTKRIGAKRIGAKRIGGKWSLKYKKSINCRHPKGFSQKQHCKYGRKTHKNIKL